MAIVVTLTGDTSDLEAKLKAAGLSIDKVGDATDGASKKADGMASAVTNLDKNLGKMEATTLRTATGRADAVADAFGNTERVMLGVNDNLGVMAEQFGINVGPAQEYVAAMANVAGGLEGVIGGGMALVQQFGPMVTGFVPLIASTWAHVTALYAQAAAMIAANLPLIAIIATFALLAAGVVLLVTHWDTIVEKFPLLGEATEKVKAALDALVSFVTDTLVPGFQAGFSVLATIVQTQVDIWVVIIQTVVDIIKGIIDVFIGVFTGDWQRAWDGVKQIFQAAWDGMKEALGIAIDAVKKLMGDLPQQLLEALGNLGDLLLQAGKDIVQGMIDGIKSMAGAATGAVKDLAGDMVSGAKDKLKIWSPSQVFKEIGENISQGLAVGIDAGAGAARDAAGNLIASVVPQGSSARVEGAISGLDFDSKELTNVNAAYWLFRDGVISEAEMWNVLVREGVAKELSSANASGGSLLGIGNAPGGESGAVLTGSPTPTLGGSGASSNNKPPAKTPSGALKADEEMLQLLRDIKRNGDQSVDVLKVLLDIARRPQELMLTIGGTNLDKFIAMLFDKLAQIQRRQSGLTA